MRWRCIQIIDKQDPDAGRWGLMSLRRQLSEKLAEFIEQPGVWGVKVHPVRTKPMQLLGSIPRGLYEMSQEFDIEQAETIHVKPYVPQPISALPAKVLVRDMAKELLSRPKRWVSKLLKR